MHRQRSEVLHPLALATVASVEHVASVLCHSFVVHVVVIGQYHHSLGSRYLFVGEARTY